VKILVAETKNFSEEAISELRLLGELTLNDIEEKDLSSALRTYDVFWFRLGFRISEHHFPEEIRTKYILCPVTGIDHIDLSACERRGIHVISLKGETAFLRSVRATAEHTIGLTLAIMRKVPFAVNSVNEGTWNRDLFKGREIYGKTVSILGVGRLGTIVAGYYKSFGAHVLGYDRTNFDPAICEKAESIESLFEKADILSVHVDFNKETHHLVNRNLLDRMKPTAFLINTSRGAVIHSEDMVLALKNWRIMGAALDVIENEFSTDIDPLIAYAREHDNLIITPHIGGNTFESFAKTELFILEKLKSALLIEQ
jgi:D-3-phosphoglycerate dehydrogenase